MWGVRVGEGVYKKGKGLVWVWLGVENVEYLGDGVGGNVGLGEKRMGGVGGILWVGDCDVVFQEVVGYDEEYSE